MKAWGSAPGLSSFKDVRALKARFTATIDEAIESRCRRFILSGDFLSGVLQHNFPADCQQNWPMENDQKSRAYSEADQQTMPNPTVASHLFVIVFGH
jgi:hypothetical protein